MTDIPQNDQASLLEQAAIACEQSITRFNERAAMAAAHGANSVRSRPRATGGARAATLYQ